jgi:tetratricopeptide (TPR) repeat protein
MNHDRLHLLLFIATVLAFLLAWCTSAWAGPVNEDLSAGRGALDWAFRFANAIDPDPKDKARAQESVVRDFAAVGDLDVALRRAEEIDGWRQAVVYADLATELAQADRQDEARELLTRAENLRRGIKGWQNPRIAAHIAQALAALGEIDRSRRLAVELVAYDGQQYLGRSVAMVATGLAANGEYEQAREELDKLAESRDIYETWWRTAAYLSLARDKGLTEEQRLEALIEARRSADGIDGWKRAEALASIAEEFIDLGQTKRARKILREADAIVAPLPDALSVKALLLTTVARPWAMAGEEGHARELLAQAEPLVANAMNIEQPGVWANVAIGYVALGDTAEAQRLYATALASAESLANARPRALAIVTICRSMGRHGVELSEATEEHLQALFEGLQDPW